MNGITKVSCRVSARIIKMSSFYEVNDYCYKKIQCLSFKQKDNGSRKSQHITHI
ncbi:hypothetical protein AKA01nite_15180 [Alkalibacterium kapii]|uniref:Uncharacterized protein n=1 Tax=Alkalibacterium kapii TaxID=426704 RepID=A0A511AUR6_9LACT|nr:hypothetical protein AKA01nite_15180 [Alkalibacterium kapii]